MTTPTTAPVEPTTRYRVRVNPVDLRPLQSTQWWAAHTADVAEAIESAAGSDDLPAVRRRLTMLATAVENLTASLDRAELHAGDRCGCGVVDCGRGCFV